MNQNKSSSQSMREVLENGLLPSLRMKSKESPKERPVTAAYKWLATLERPREDRIA